MTTYIVQMMDEYNYGRGCAGYLDFHMEEVLIDADTPEEARAIAMATYPTMIINNYIISVEEKAAKEARIEAELKAEREKKAAAKARKKAREEAKAAELGLTYGEYKAKLKKEKDIKLTMKRIAQLETELAEAKAWLEKAKNS